MHSQDKNEIQSLLKEIEEEFVKGIITEEEYKKQKETYEKLESVIDSIESLIKNQRN